MFRKMFFPVGFQSPVSPLLVFLMVYSFQGIERKNHGMCWRHTYFADVSI